MHANRSILLALLLTGCSQTYTEPVLTEDHPASPRGAVSPLPARSTALTMPGPSGPEVAPEDGATAEAAAAGADGQRYVCPMHPEVTSAEPGRCPVCRMRLVEREGER